MPKLSLEMNQLQLFELQAIVTECKQEVKKSVHSKKEEDEKIRENLENLFKTFTEKIITHVTDTENISKSEIQTFLKMDIGEEKYLLHELISTSINQERFVDDGELYFDESSVFVERDRIIATKEKIEAYCSACNDFWAGINLSMSLVFTSTSYRFTLKLNYELMKELNEPFLKPPHK